MNPFSQRSDLYKNRISNADEQIAATQALLSQQKKQAVEPRKVSMQDALINAVVTLLPGVLGTAIAGKEGLYHGLVGGAEGNKLYSQNIADKNARLDKQSALDAETTASKLKSLQDTKEGAQDRLDSLSDKVAFSDYTAPEKLQRAKIMARQLMGESDGTINLSKQDDGSYGIDPSVKFEDESTYAANPQASPSSTPTPSTPDQNAIKEALITAGVPLEMADQIGVDTVKKIQDIDKGNIDIQGKETENKKSELELDEKERLKSSTEAVLDFGFAKARPTRNASPEQVKKARETLSHYKTIHSGLKEMAEYADKSNALERSGITNKQIAENLRGIRQRIATAYQGLVRAKEADPRASTFTYKDALNWVPDMGGIYNEATGVLSSMSPVGSTVHNELKRAINEAQAMLKDDLSSLGYEIVTDEVDNVGGGGGEMTATNPQTGEKIILRDGKWEPYNAR